MKNKSEYRNPKQIQMTKMQNSKMEIGTEGQRHKEKLELATDFGDLVSYLVSFDRAQDRPREAYLDVWMS